MKKSNSSKIIFCFQKCMLRFNLFLFYSNNCIHGFFFFKFGFRVSGLRLCEWNLILSIILIISIPLLYMIHLSLFFSSVHIGLLSWHSFHIHNCKRSRTSSQWRTSLCGHIWDFSLGTDFRHIVNRTKKLFLCVEPITVKNRPTPTLTQVDDLILSYIERYERETLTQYSYRP